MYWGVRKSGYVFFIFLNSVLGARLQNVLGGSEIWDIYFLIFILFYVFFYVYFYLVFLMFSYFSVFFLFCGFIC